MNYTLNSFGNCWMEAYGKLLAWIKPLKRSVRRKQNISELDFDIAFCGESFEGSKFAIVIAFLQL